MGEFLTKREAELQNLSHEVYRERLDVGVAREQARKDLALSTYTEAYWKIDLHNLFHFLSLRMDNHAQKEIREYAFVIGNKIVSQWCPVAWGAFVDYQLKSCVLSGIEWTILRAIVSDDPEKAKEIAATTGMLRHRGGKLVRNREREEFEAKIQDLGLPVPWLNHE